jgi:hypothetical protein
MQDFKTRDFQVAAFLIAKGYRLLATSRQRNSLVFHFPASAKTDALLYFNDFAIPCRSFYAAIKELKSLIHGSRELANTMEDDNYEEFTPLSKNK